MRARNIKAELFKNEILGTRDPLLTIIFIGLWCAADRDGFVEDRPMRLKAEILPYRDTPDFDKFFTELSDLGFIHRFSVDGKKFIRIENFAKHQKPHHTEKKSWIKNLIDNSNGCELTVSSPLDNGEYPPDSLITDSLITDSLIPDSHEAQPHVVPVENPPASVRPSCPHEKIIGLYHEILPALPRVSLWGDASMRALKTRWREDRARQNTDWWAGFFKYISESDYLMGRVNGFQADLGWIVTSKNFEKIVNGRYRNRQITGSRITDQNIRAVEGFLRG